MLAFLAILVWHIYNVHIKTFNRSIFTGKLTREQMQDEHPKELERIETGQVRPEPPRETIRRRERVFLPLAITFAVVTTIVLYFFVTYEETAIATIPPIPGSVEVFVKATATPVADDGALWLGQTEAIPIPHGIAEGRENCLSCHGVGALFPFTEIHAELRLGNETCLSCHSLVETDEGELPTVEVASAPSFAHDIVPVLQRKCVACHGINDDLTLIDYDSLVNGGEQRPGHSPWRRRKQPADPRPVNAVGSASHSPVGGGTGCRSCLDSGRRAAKLNCSNEILRCCEHCFPLMRET